jgi:uncharacterized protein
MVIDAWMQHPGQSWLDNAMFDLLQRWKPGPWSQSAQPIEKTLEAMDGAGVSYHEDDQRIASVRRGSRLPGSARAALAVGAAARRPPLQPAVRVLLRPRRHVLHSGRHAGRLRASDPGRPIPYLDNVAQEFPDLRIAGGHIGVPWLDEMISLATMYPNVYIETLAVACARYPTGLLEYMKEHGRRKVLFGSSHPFWPAADGLAGIDQLDRDAQTRQAFLHDNAARVFSLS